jgi:hypothetical protein
MRPSDQYPIGGGGLQWTLVNPCKFLIAMTVDDVGIATVAANPPFPVFLGESATYEDRAKVAKVLDRI